MRQINQDVLDRSIRYLREKGIMDEEDIHYKIGKFPVSREEFGELINALVDVSLEREASREVPGDEDDNDEDGYSLFSEERTSFRYQGVNFTLSTLFGQGSVTTLFRDDYNPEYCPFVDENVVDLNEYLAQVSTGG